MSRPEAATRYLPHVARLLADQAARTADALDFHTADVPPGFANDAQRLERLADEVRTVADRAETEAQAEASAAPWIAGDIDGEYRDWHHTVPDAGGYGVRLRLTLDTARRVALLIIEIDDEAGDIHADTGAAVPYPVACAMVGYTPDTLEA